jgi:hypothetical protein
MMFRSIKKELRHGTWNWDQQAHVHVCTGTATRLYGRLLYGSSYFNKAAGYEISEISEKRLSFRNSVLPTIRFQLPSLLE